MRYFAWLVGSVLAGATAWYLIFARPALLELRQVSNHGRCQGSQGWVQRQHEQTGAYPAALPAEFAMDAWGHAIHYTRLADGYLLVSFGRDGRPDGSDYMALREAGSHPPGCDICGSFDADEVMSDKGWHRLCGK